MFNQKLNGYLSENQDYINSSYSAPLVRQLDVHRCGTTINKYTKSGTCSSLPLQTWCSANVAVESFGMRPILNSKEYFQNLNKYLSSIVYTDSIPLKRSNLASEQYSLVNEIGNEPSSSFLEAIKLEITDHLNYILSASTDQIDMFKNFNPICEGFVMTDITLTTYISFQNRNHFFHRVLFSAFNTTRYNTVSFKAEIYQDTTSMRSTWNRNIDQVMNSQDVSRDTNANTDVYISLITLMNDTNCVLGQESECEFKAHNMSSSFSQLINENFLSKPSGLDWLQPDAIIENTYNLQGNYDTDGNIKIIDYGPSNLDQLIKNLK